MSFIQVISEAEATGDVKAVYEKTLAGLRPSVRRRDVDPLREAGLADKDIRLISAAIAHHNYSIRLAAAFDVIPR